MLLIESNADVADVVKDRLAWDGHDVRIAKTFDKGQSMIQQWNPTVVLLEQSEQSEEDLRRIETLLSSRGDLRIVLLLEGDDSALAESVLRAGAQGHLTKPFRLAQLRVALGKNPAGPERRSF